MYRLRSHLREDGRPTPPGHRRRSRDRLPPLHNQHSEPSAVVFLSGALSSLRICPLLHHTHSCTLQAAPPALRGRRSGTQSASSTPGGLGLGGGGSCSKTADPSLRHLCITLCVFLFLSSVYVKSVKIYYSSCSNGECYLPGCLLISTTTRLC
jgi:hypothetical protein